MKPEPIPNLVGGLPRLDVLMCSALMGVMLVADAAALAKGIAPRMAPSLVIMPAILAVVWTCYAGSIAWMRRMKSATPAAVLAAAGLMGLTQSMLAAVLTAGHLGLLGFATGLIASLNADTFLRLFFVALSLLLIQLHNRIPKLVSRHSPPDVAIWTLNASWIGVICGVMMTLASLLLPLGRIAPVIITLGCVPTLFLFGCLLAGRRNRRSGAG